MRRPKHFGTGTGDSRVLEPGLAQCQSEHTFGWRIIISPASLASARRTAITYFGEPRAWNLKAQTSHLSALGVSIEALRKAASQPHRLVRTAVSARDGARRAGRSHYGPAMQSRSRLQHPLFGSGKIIIQTLE
jgi:hypothetical protein